MIECVESKSCSLICVTERHHHHHLRRYLKSQTKGYTPATMSHSRYHHHLRRKNMKQSQLTTTTTKYHHRIIPVRPSQIWERTSVLTPGTWVPFFHPHFLSLQRHLDSMMMILNRLILLIIWVMNYFKAIHRILSLRPPLNLTTSRSTGVVRQHWNSQWNRHMYTRISNLTTLFYYR